MCKKVRIMLIHTSIGIGGAEKILNFLSNILSENYDVKLLLLVKKELTMDILPQVNVTELNCYSRNSILGKNFFSGINKLHNMSNQICEEIKKFNPLLIICFDLRILLVLSKMRRKYKLNILFSERTDPYENPKYWEILLKYIYKKIAYIVFQTKEAQEFYGDKIKKKSCIIPNPAFKRLKEEKYYAENVNYIFGAGRLQRRKGFDLLVKAFAIFDQKCPGYTLIIYGEGVEKDNILRIAEENNISDKVEIRDFVNGVIQKNAHASLFVIPSRSEGIPNILIEAILEGIPSVAADCSPGGAKLISNNGEYCLLANNNDEKSLGEKMIEAIQYTEETKKRVKEATLSMDRFDEYKIADMWKEVIADIVEVIEDEKNKAVY